MDEPLFARLAKQYICLLDHEQDLKPMGWSQDDHTREHLWRMKLLKDMKEALSEQENTQ